MECFGSFKKVEWSFCFVFGDGGPDNSKPDIAIKVVTVAYVEQLKLL
jgi:hypothetical protein